MYLVIWNEVLCLLRTVPPVVTAHTFCASWDIHFILFYFISFAKETKPFNVTKLKKGVGRDTTTAEASYSGPG